MSASYFSAGVAAIALVFLSPITPQASAQSDGSGITVYICDGESKDICGDQPNPLPGFNGWTGGPRGREHDTDYHDDMGPATTTNPGPPPTACVKVSNSGGDLFGPGGGDQNGGFEGACIEVMICWPYSRTYEKAFPCATYGQKPGFGTCWITVTETWEACSDWIEVCPCAEGDAG